MPPAASVRSAGARLIVLDEEILDRAGKPRQHVLTGTGVVREHNAEPIAIDEIGEVVRETPGDRAMTRPWRFVHDEPSPRGALA